MKKAKELNEDTRRPQKSSSKKDIGRYSYPSNGRNKMYLSTHTNGSRWEIVQYENKIRWRYYKKGG